MSAGFFLPEFVSDKSRNLQEDAGLCGSGEEEQEEVGAPEAGRHAGQGVPRRDRHILGLVDLVATGRERERERRAGDESAIQILPYPHLPRGVPLGQKRVAGTDAILRHKWYQFQSLALSDLF